MTNIDRRREKATIRRTAKAWLKLEVNACGEWCRDGQEDRARGRKLIITKTLAKKTKIKSSCFSNGGSTHTAKKHTYFQT
ncbi:MAG TPA: hypothetical protein VK957_06430 [Lunatimonas sp.]|nr:hypothetical protein [Lunatimonas sp.]